MTVTLQDQALDRIAPALKRAHALFSKRLREPLKIRDTFDRLIPDPQGDGVPHADVIIEAIFENVADALERLRSRAQGLERRELELGYFALVRNSTGEDWKNIALTLSTARPSLGGGVTEPATRAQMRRSSGERSPRRLMRLRRSRIRSELRVSRRRLAVPVVERR